MKPSIFFFEEKENFKLKNKAKIKKWLIKIADIETKAILSLNYIFCDDDYLLKINIDFLNHDTLTDIITFQNNTDNQPIEGEIYISVDRIQENAILHNTTFENELLRVIAHGALHLCGYKDKTKEQKTTMTAKEEKALLLYETSFKD